MQSDAEREIMRRLRQYYAGEFHELLGTFHAGVLLELEIMKDLLTQGKMASLDETLGRVTRSAELVASEIRRLMRSLRDSTIDDVGLISALARYVSIVKPNVITFRCSVDQRLEPDVEYALFNIAQAAIHNAIQHSGVVDSPVGKVAVDLERDKNNVTLRISDSGSGFDLDSVKASGSGFGLYRMQHLAQSIGAAFQVRTGKDAGTEISISVPISQGAGPSNEQQ